MGDDYTQETLQLVKPSAIINISKKILSRAEQEVLEMGLSFVPGVAMDFTKIKLEVMEFFRKVRLRWFFKDATDQVSTEASGLRNKSSFCPPNHHVSKNILAFERSVMSSLNVLEKKRPFVPRNITKEHREAIQVLKTQQEAVIRQADKGGAVVLWSKDLYRTEGRNHVYNQEWYRRITHDPTIQIQNEVGRLVNAAKEAGILGPKESEYLVKQHPRTPHLYFLPKVHKDPKIPPGRPIVSGCDSVFEPISKFVDVFLKPLVVQVPSYLRDTMDFINKVEGLAFDPSCQLLASMDVSSLYTQIPQQDGLDVMELYLDRRPRPHRVPTELIISFATVALKKNFFTFEDEMFLQIKGSAMGCPFAPEMAILYMGQYEEKYVLNNNPYGGCIGQWLRYIDDVWCVWNGTSTQLEEFHVWLNDRSPDIKFSLSYHERSLPFLDVEISVKDNVLSCSLFQKKTDKNNALHYKSYHPRSLRDNLPYGQYLRVRRNCSTIQQFELHGQGLTSKLKERGYPHKLLKHSMKRARWTPREHLLEKRPRLATERMVCVSTFGPHTNQLQNIIKKSWHLVQEILPDIGAPLFALKKNRSIGEMITSTRPPPKRDSQTTIFGTNPVKGHRKCGTCSVCDLTIEGSLFTDGNKFWRHNEHTNCKTKYTVYAIQCPCKKLYIGKTTQEVRQRIIQHRSRINNKNMTAPLVSHFLQQKHSCIDIRWTVLAVIRGGTGDPDLRLSQKEAYLILKFDTSNSGLNEMSETASL
ncbi:uncharacterized protein LOC144785528 [Lissotriton helveticus]